MWGNAAKWKPPDVLQIRSQSRWKMPSEVRNQILERDGYKCWYCGEDGDTVDHWIPLCRGGTNAMVNLVCACSSCNELKGNCMPDDFLSITEMAWWSKQRISATPAIAVACTWQWFLQGCSRTKWSSRKICRGDGLCVNQKIRIIREESASVRSIDWL